MRLSLFTDGSAKVPKKGGTEAGGYGFLLTDPSRSKRYFLRYAFVPDTTISRMELSAVVVGLEQIMLEDREKRVREVIVYTDSRYVSNAFDFKLLSNWEYFGWTTVAGEPVKNKDLWLDLKSVLADCTKRGIHVRAKKVKAHSGHPENEFVDSLATKARTRKMSDYARLNHLY